MKRTCATCGASTEATYRLCRPCLRARTLAERQAQGLPEKITDPTVLAQVSTLIRSSRVGSWCAAPDIDGQPGTAGAA